MGVSFFGLACPVLRSRALDGPLVKPLIADAIGVGPTFRPVPCRPARPPRVPPMADEVGPLLGIAAPADGAAPPLQGQELLAVEGVAHTRPCLRPLVVDTGVIVLHGRPPRHIAWPVLPVDDV